MDGKYIPGENKCQTFRSFASHTPCLCIVVQASPKLRAVHLACLHTVPVLNALTFSFAMHFAITLLTILQWALNPLFGDWHTAAQEKLVKKE